MIKRSKILEKYDAFRDAIYAMYERQFPSPVQVRLIEILGGTTITIGAIRRHNMPMTITLSRGRLLRSSRLRRGYLDGMGVLANDIQWAIAIKGPEFERDVIMAYERDEKLQQMGWRLAYISARDIWQNPARVRASILPFLNA
jgi:hypothetical protein